MSAKPFVFDTDVLIIGGGFSGSWAALTARCILLMSLLRLSMSTMMKY